MNSLGWGERRCQGSIPQAVQRGGQAQLHTCVLLTPKSKLTAPSRGAEVVSCRWRLSPATWVQCLCAPPHSKGSGASEYSYLQGKLPAGALFGPFFAMTLLPPQSSSPCPRMGHSRAPTCVCLLGDGPSCLSWGLTCCCLPTDITLDCDMNCEDRQDRSFVDKVGF